MPAKAEGKKVLIIIAPSNFRDEELFLPKEVLESAGVKVTIASKTTGTIIGKLGGRAEAELALKDADASDYDAVVFVGGPGASAYFNDRTALELAKDASRNGKLIAAICIAPSILANAGLLSGKRATAFPSEEGNLKAKGATYTNEPVTTDRKIITANGPAAAREFGEAIVDAIRN